MGQTLSEPIVEKETEEDQNERFAYAVSSMQGWRINMEDAHAMRLSYNGDKTRSFFAVYDGHGGDRVAKYAGLHLDQLVAISDEYKESKYPEAMKKAFLGLDEKMREDPQMKNVKSGATAVATLITEETIYCANAGDSRAVLCVKGAEFPLSHDHKPTNPEEVRRIIAADGYVEFGRVRGNLALSRAVGDFEFKTKQNFPAEDQMVTANPDIIEHPLNEDVEFMVVACDGIWECMTNQDVVTWVRDRLAISLPLTQICEDLMTRCLATDATSGPMYGCDNMTVCIVVFKHGGKSVQEVCQELAKIAPEATTLSANDKGEDDESGKEDNSDEADK
eukprot:CFRG6422T1